MPNVVPTYPVHAAEAVKTATGSARGPGEQVVETFQVSRDFLVPRPDFESFQKVELELELEVLWYDIFKWCAALVSTIKPCWSIASMPAGPHAHSMAVY